MSDDNTTTVSVDSLDNPEPGDYIEVDGEYGVIETVVGSRARIDFNAEVPARLKESVRTTSVDNIPTPGDYVEVDGEFGEVETVIGQRARINLDAVGPGDMSGDESDNTVTCSVDSIPTPGDYVSIGDDYGTVETVIGERARINLDSSGPKREF